MASRRKFLIAATILGPAAYTYQRGLRYPRLGFEHRLTATSNKNQFAALEFSNAILRAPSPETSDLANFQFRAVAPELSIKLTPTGAETFTITVSNLSSTAILKIVDGSNTKIDEQIEGTNRYLEISGNADHSLTLNWVLAEQNGVRFAALGDTGAGLELEWALKRAHQLGAQFLLHLGDFNYGPNEYTRAIELFDSAPLPCYVSIGNHDYNDSGLVYRHFLDNIGPMNQSFNIAGTRFVNIDTAVNFLPANSGQRGQLFSDLRQDNSNFDDSVFFTHKPFVDIRPGEDHNISGLGEMAWLSAKIKDCGPSKFLCGHVHRSGESDYQGIQQYTVGEGLGFEDIVQQRKVAKLLIGTIEPGQAVTYQWQPLEMPWGVHRCHKNKIKLINEYSAEKLQWYKQMLEQNPG